MFTYVAGKKLTVYVESAEQWHNRPLYSAIVQACWDHGIAGATVIRCEEGYGGRHVHHARLWSLNDDLPVRVEIVETAERFPKGCSRRGRPSWTTCRSSRKLRTDTGSCGLVSSAGRLASDAPPCRGFAYFFSIR